MLAAVLLAATLATCGSPAQSGQDDALSGYWIGGGESGMRLVHIVKEGAAYRVLANPDFEAPSPELKDGALVVDTHSVVMSLIPAGKDRLDLQLSGQMFETPETTALKRVDETKYADAATSLGIDTIRNGLSDWKAGGGKKYPPAAEVAPSGMLAKMVSWPNNLFTGQPMQPGETPGDYVYKQLDGGKKYSLVGYLSDGSTIGE